MDCSRPGCGGTAIIDRPYAGDHLCTLHFRESIRDRVRRELHHQAPGLRGGLLAVGLSGGKDSAVTLALTHRILGSRRGLRMVAITIDEGISDYRPRTVESARELTRRLGIPHVVRSFSQELGTRTEEAARLLHEGAPCSWCGVWRRRLLNQAARELGAVRLAMGFNLDDLAQTVLMNLVRGEPHRLVQMAPHARRQPALVPRIAPLASIPEREVYLYARLEGIPFDHAQCPFAPHGGRNLFRDVLWQLEEKIPGSRHALLKTREKLLPLLLAGEPFEGPGTCPHCGEPSSGSTCRSCAYLEALQGARENGFIVPSGSGDR